MFRRPFFVTLYWKCFENRSREARESSQRPCCLVFFQIEIHMDDEHSIFFVLDIRECLLHLLLEGCICKACMWWQNCCTWLHLELRLLADVSNCTYRAPYQKLYETSFALRKSSPKYLHSSRRHWNSYSDVLTETIIVSSIWIVLQKGPYGRTFTYYLVSCWKWVVHDIQWLSLGAPIDDDFSEFPC